MTVTEWLLSVLATVSTATILGAAKYVVSRLGRMDSVLELVATVKHDLEGTVQAAALEPRLAEISSSVRDNKKGVADLSTRVARIEGRLDA